MVRWKQNNWGSDTCRCKITFEWDDDLPEHLRVYSHFATIRKCPAHAALDGNTLYQTMLDENNRKNDLMSLAVQLKPSIRPPEDVSLRTIYDFYFDGSRALHITILGLNSTEKTTLQGLADTRFGTGKVIIE